MTGGKLVGANDDVVLLKRAADTVFRQLVIVSSFENSGWQKELLFDFLRPLFAQICRRDDKDASLALCPFLGKHKACFNCLSEAYLIRKDRTLR